MKNDLLTREQAIRLFDYDPDEGVLRWKFRTPDMFESGARSAEQRCSSWNGRCAGKAAGSVSGYGYFQVGIPGRILDLPVENLLCLSHRIIWLIVYGHWPEDQVDHRDGVGTNNLLSNLREATQSQNQHNRKDRSKHVGASWHRKSSKWQARISTNGKMRTLGYYDTAEEAHHAYVVEKAVVHEFNPVLRVA